MAELQLLSFFQLRNDFLLGFRSVGTKTEMRVQSVLLHIGMSKSGSTAIQDVLWNNESLLRRRGVCVPKIGVIDGAHFGVFNAVSQGMGKTDIGELLAVCGDLPLCVLSCEAFWTMGSEKVVSFIEEFGGVSVQSVLYLRNPWAYVQSSYRQSIKGPGRSESPQQHLERIRDRLDYPSLIKRWANCTDLSVFVYDLVASNLEASFVNVLCGDGHELDIVSRSVNKTPSDKTISTIRFMNRFVKGGLGKRVRRFLVKKDLSAPFAPPIEDECLMEFASESVRSWDLETLRSYVGEDGVQVLTQRPL